MNVNLQVRTHLYDELVTVAEDIPVSDAAAIVDELEQYNLFREAVFVETPTDPAELPAAEKNKAEAIISVKEKRKRESV